MAQSSRGQQSDDAAEVDRSRRYKFTIVERDDRICFVLPEEIDSAKRYLTSASMIHN
jgi:hypothetical protein